MNGQPVYDFEIILQLRMKDGLTIKEYLRSLLLVLWAEKDEFSGKRPFGNSDWEYDLYECLVAHNIVDGCLDEFGDIDYVDNYQADMIINNCINQVFK